MKNIIKIQSIGDIITNSSTEVFTIIDSGTVTKMKDFIKVLLGEDALNRFEIKLDPKEAFTNLDADDACETFTCRIEEIDDSIDFEEIINEKGTYSVFDMLCHFYFPDYKYTKDAAEFDDNIKEILKQIDIEEIVEDNNEGRDYPVYPNLIIRAVDPNNKKDVEIAKKLQNIPFFCETEARYC